MTPGLLTCVLLCFSIGAGLGLVHPDRVEPDEPY
jgi:hypothetical protein